MRIEIEMIVEAGRNDTDQWVSMVADIIKNYPSSGMLNTSIEQDDSTHFFNEILGDLKKIGKLNSFLLRITILSLFLNTLYDFNSKL